MQNLYQQNRMIVIWTVFSLTLLMAIPAIAQLPTLNVEALKTNKLTISKVILTEVEPNNSIASANAISIGDSLVGHINEIGDSDYFILSISAPQALEVSVHTTTPFSELNTYLEIYDENGTLLTYNDNAFPSFDSRVIYEFTRAGAYYIRLGDYWGFTGSTSLSHEYLLLSRPVVARGDSNMALLSSTETVLPVYALAKSNDILFAAEGTFFTFFKSYDVSNLSNPVLLDSIQISGPVNDILILNDIAFLATNNESTAITIIDIQQPGNLSELAVVNGFVTTSLQIDHDTLYAAENEGGGLATYNISDPGAPALMWRFSAPDSNASSVSVGSDHLYLTTTGGEIFILDKTTGVQQSYVAGSGYIVDSNIKGGLLFLTDIYGNLLSYDIATPQQPFLLDSLNLNGGSSFAFHAGLSGNNIYISNGIDGIKKIDISDPSDLRVSGYYFSKPNFSALQAVVEDDKIFVASGELLDIFGGDLKNSLVVLQDNLVSAIDDHPATGPATAFTLHQNYPNPFNPSTTIVFDLQKAGQAHLSIFNSLGQEVFRWADNFAVAGTHRITWDGKNKSGQAVASGAYFYQLRVGDQVRTRKMLLVQ